MSGRTMAAMLVMAMAGAAGAQGPALRSTQAVPRIAPSARLVSPLSLGNLSIPVQVTDPAERQPVVTTTTFHPSNKNLSVRIFNEGGSGSGQALLEARITRSDAGCHMGTKTILGQTYTGLICPEDYGNGITVYRLVPPLPAHGSATVDMPLSEFGGAFRDCSKPGKCNDLASALNAAVAAAYGGGTGYRLDLRLYNGS